MTEWWFELGREQSMTKPFTFNRANGAVFGELDVARCYAHRPPYAPALYDRLLQVVRGRERAVDLGCGPGKIALELAPHFREVIAVDPSGPMLEAGRELSDRSNIDWRETTTEALELDAPVDAITIGAAVHWMDHPVVFPKMARWLGDDGVLAILGGGGGSGVAVAPWGDSWLEFLKAWLARVGQEYNRASFVAAGEAYMSWMDIAGREDFAFTFEQPVEDFVAAQHSTATFARAKMGEALAAEFDADLLRVLEPAAETGILRFEVQSSLVWGRPRVTRKDNR
jgi:SAM-dependent methyltransferase